jgi:thymidylate synthase
MLTTSFNSKTWFPQASFTGSSFSEAWYYLLNHLAVRGQVISPRGILTREQLNVQLHVSDLQNNILDSERNLNHKFMVAEWLWIMAGSDNLETIAQYNSQMRRFTDNGVVLTGAYGPRLMPQLHYLIHTLMNDPNTRQAVATIWTPNPQPSKDIPCTISLQVLIRDGHLHGIVNMRSSDIWLGLPYDFFTFSMIVNYIGLFFATCAPERRAQLGSLSFNLGSSHIYLTDIEKALTIKPGMNVRSPRVVEPMRDAMELVLQQPKNMVDLSTFPAPWATYAKVLVEPRERALIILKELASA